MCDSSLQVDEPEEAAKAASYLEYSGKVVTDTRYEVTGCSCRSRFCKDCATSRGYQLRTRLTYRSQLSECTTLQMWTLTIDPKLFESPEAAYLYCRDKKVISRLMRALRRSGHLLSHHYFCAIEWQKDTQMVHFHLLVSAKFIPFPAMCEAWNSNRPKDAPEPKEGRPGFGSVRFSVPKFADARHAINYATKYVIKTPEHGWPEWVMDSRKNVPRYQASRGFWTDGDSGTKAPVAPSDN